MTKKLLKALPFVAFTIFLLLSGVQSSNAQCTVDYDITFNPPVPADGAYDAGTTVEVCIDINNITLGGANWLSGIEFLLPPGWDASSFANIDPPEACANGGTWTYYDALSCGGYNLGPGFYYDVNSGGPQDGDPCNNFGDPCFTNADWSFCAEITLDADCGGAGNPLDGEVIVPGIAIYGDGDIGSWGIATPCVAAGNNEFYPDPAEVSFELNCCDAEVGESPGTLPICENGTICLFDEIIGTPDAGGVWDGPTGWIPDGTDCGSFDPTTDPPGEYTYSVIGTGGCVNSVTINMEYLDLGVVQTVAYCDPDPTCLTDEVTTIVLPPGGTWFYPDGTTVAGCTVDPSVDPAGEYVYEFFDASNCLTYATLDLLFSPASASGCFTTYDYCSDQDNLCPFDQMGCNPNGGGQWVLYDNNDVFANFYPNTDVCFTNAEIDAALPGNIEDGFYFVYLLGAFPCAPGIDTVQVNYFEPFDPGTFTQASICVTDPPIDMVTLIEGTPDPGGTFQITGGGPIIPNPIDPSNYAPGDFLQLSYSGGLDNTNCFGSNIVEITFLPADADAGDPNTITVCESDPFFNMVDSLGGNPQSGGTWTNPSGTNTNFGNFFTPGSNSPGTYTYTVTSSCDSDQSTLEIIVVTDVDAGADGVLDICDNETGVALTDGQSPPGQAGGNWFDAGFNPVAGNVDGASLTDGDVFSYVISSGPCADTAEVVINLTPAPDAGVLTTVPQEFCETDGPLDLMTLFTTNPSEIDPNYWSGPGGPTGGTFDPSTDPAGVYGYTIPDQGCGPASVSLLISIETQPNAGADGNFVACPNDATPVNLISLLGGAATGGTWSGPSPLGGGDLGTFNPSSDLAGTYTYTLTSAPNGLCTDQATVNVTFETLPDPGTNGTITLCESDPPVDLITVLNGTPDNGGTWSGPSPLGGGDQGTFNPAVANDGIYTYSVGIGSCPDETAQVQVIVLDDPNPGVSTSAAVCESFGNVNLLSLLNGTPETGGTWTDIGGNPVSDPYDVTGQCSATPILLTYTVDNGTCSESADLTLTIECSPNAGPDRNYDYCGDGTLINLNDSIEPPADLTGSWTPTMPITADAANAGVYTYTVAGVVCSDDQASYIVNITDEISTTAPVATCQPNQTEYTITFDISGGTPPYTVNGTVVAGSTYNSGVLPLTGSPFAIVVEDSGPCSNLNFNVTEPTCLCPATASWSSSDVTICSGETANLELDLVGAGPFTVEYDDGTGAPFISVPNLSDGDVIQVSPATTTTYTLESVQDINCLGTAAGTITVTVEDPPNAGPDQTFNYCGDGTLVDLNDSIPATADLTGNWNPAVPFSANTANAGVYTYTVNGNACPDDDANYIINITDELTTTSPVTSCEPNQTEFTITFDISGGTPPYSVNGNPLVGTTYNSGILPLTGSAFPITVSDSGPCDDLTFNVNEPNCSCPATASWATSNTTICLGESVDLALNLSGQAPFEVTYNGNIVPGLSDGDVINVTPTTTTTYVLEGVSDANCVGTANGSITVTVENPPNAGPDQTYSYCGDGTFVNLNDSIQPPAGLSGTWSPAVPFAANTSNAGIYTYTVNGNVCPPDDANYNIIVEEPLATQSLTALCEANQTEYTVCFDITGGDGNYSVTGDSGNLIGNQFCSDPISVGSPYSFTISSGGLCSDLTVSGNSPDCNCTAQGSITGNAEICSGDCTNITFNLSGGNPPYDVTYDGPDGTNQQLNGISDGHVLTVCPTSGGIYTLTSVSDANCTGTVTGSQVTINVDQPVFVSNIEEECDPTNQFYTLTFEITGGNGNYLVFPQDGSPAGSLNAGEYSVDISSGDGYSYSVTSTGNSCDAVLVETPFFDCGCATDAGSVSTTPLFVCEGECTQVIHFGNEFLDGNDILQFVLHDGTADALGNVIDTSNDGEFCFNYSQVNSGEVYYISAVAGNDQFGNVDLNDPCLSVSTGVEVTQNALPSASIFGGGTVCPGEQVDLTISFTGTGPWDFRYSDGTIESDLQTSTSNTFTLSVTQPGTYTVTEMSDSNCTGSTFGQATIQNYQPPTATISGDPNVCEGSGDGPLVEFNGTPPFSFTYAINGDEQEQIFNIPANSFTIPADDDGNYTLVTLSDNNCEGSVSGSVGITIIEQPTATISGGGVVCEGDEATFNITLTGNAPWTINYTIDGLPNSETVDSPNYSFQSGIDGDYVITSVQDADCQAEVASQASLVVNPLPTAELTSNSSTFCIGQEVNLSMVLNGNPPFNVTYAINGDTLTATGIQSSIFETLTPDEPVLAEVIFIEDGSNPVCSNQPDASVFVAPTELPNAPTLQDDTLCSADGRIQIGVTPVEGLSYSWSPESNLTDPDIANPEFVAPNIPGAQPVEYEYIVTASNGDCEATDTMSLVLDPGPIARFSYSPNPVTTEDTRTFFTNNSIANHNTLFYWEFDTMETSFAYNPSFIFPDGVEASYLVTLTATDSITGCFDTYTERINVKPDLLIFIPSAFTPDGDGLNDLWGPVLSNIDPNDYRLTVMDRWGEIVFETRDPNKKWNGGMNNGDYFAQPGVYIWIVETKEIGSLEEITQTGQVTLVR